MLASLRSALIGRGVLAVLVGVVAIVWPGLTVSAFVILFAVHVLLLSAADVCGALRASTTPRRVGSFVLAVVSGATGVLALLWPRVTVVVIALLVAGWASVTGLVELALALRRQASLTDRTTWTIGGLTSIALAAALVVRPDLGVVAIATVYGLFSIVQGITALVLAARLRAFDHRVTRLVAR